MDILLANRRNVFLSKKNKLPFAELSIKSAVTSVYATGTPIRRAKEIKTIV